MKLAASYGGRRSSGGALFCLHFPLELPSVPDKFSCRCEFSKPKTHHVFNNEDRHVFSPVVYADCEAYHFRSDDRSSRPRLHNGLLAGFQCPNLRKQLRISKWAFLQGAGHEKISYARRLCCRRRTINMPEGFFRFLVFTPNAGFPHGVLGCLSPMGARPSPPPCG